MKLPTVFSSLEIAALAGLWRGLCWSCKGEATYVDPKQVPDAYELTSLPCNGCGLKVELWEKIE